MNTRNEDLSTRDFDRLRGLIYDECGINLGPEKRTMLEIRLRRRLRSLDISSLSAYCDALFAPGGRKREIVQLIDVVTTNKTDFFREAAHFDYLLETALPNLIRKYGMGRRFLIWSAGCSSGQEPYTLAMVLNEYAESHHGFRFQVLATDISTTVLDKAESGIFNDEAIHPVPPNLRRKYFMHSRNPESDLVRIVPELRSQVEFRRLNFMDSDFGLSESPEVIFCRNVVIYFDRATQIRLFEKLTRYLAPGGYLFVGHSETLHGIAVSLVPEAPAVYSKAHDRNRT